MDILRFTKSSQVLFFLISIVLSDLSFLFRLGSLSSTLFLRLLYRSFTTPVSHSWKSSLYLLLRPLRAPLFTIVQLFFKSQKTNCYSSVTNKNSSIMVLVLCKNSLFYYLPHEERRRPPSPNDKLPTFLWFTDKIRYNHY